MGKDLKGKEIGNGIFQRKDGRYYAKFTNRYRQLCGHYFNDVNEAKSWLAEEKAKDQLKINIVNSSITLDIWFDKWLNEIKKNLISEGTRIIYINTYEKFIKPLLGKRKLSEITNLQIKGLINDMRKPDGEEYSYEVQNKIKLILTDMFNRAIENHLLNENPCRWIRIPKVNEEDYPNVLNMEEQKAFMDCAKGTWYYNLFYVALNTGLRPGELYCLTWDDIDYENHTIYVDKTLTYQKYEEDLRKEFHVGPPKNKYSKRFVPITKECLNKLEEQRRIRQLIQSRPGLQRKINEVNLIPLEDKDNYKININNLIFSTSHGTPLNVQIATDAIHKLLKEINYMRDEADQIIEFTPHTFRHTFATNLYQESKDIKLVSELLGHADTTMCNKLYVHNTDESIKDGINKLANRMKFLEN